QAYPLGYVEDAFEVRTMLTGFFNILMPDYGRDIARRQARRCAGTGMIWVRNIYWQISLLGFDAK
ncbi:MAG: hypothetical protein ABIU05_06955, partial [Nitrospirales bacterium]